MELNEKQRLYRDIFIRAKDALVAKLQTFKDKDARLNFLNEVVSKDVLRKLRAIQDARGKYECCRCGTCCKMASSEFSYSELLDKTGQGDVFAKSFTSVFMPYESAPEGEFDDYVALLKEREMLEETYFYYCPKCVSRFEGGGRDKRSTISTRGHHLHRKARKLANGQGVTTQATCDEVAQEQCVYHCSDYANRPVCCRDFPNNPLVILSPKCSFNAWRDEFEVEALFLNAMIELIGYFINGLR